MFHSISSKLKGGIIIKSKTITCDIGEGKIATDLSKIQNQFLNMKIGSYPYFNPQSFGTSIVIRSENIEDIDLALEKLTKIIKQFGGKYEIIT
jgi:molybdopterin-biosynthesis enzyme MoeA-like protein